jgi:hypothetical protein
MRVSCEEGVGRLNCVPGLQNQHIANFTPPEDQETGLFLSSFHLYSPP